MGNSKKPDYDLDDEQSVEGRDKELERKLFDEYHKRFVDGYIKTVSRFNEDKRFVRDDTYHNKTSNHHIVYKLILNPEATELKDKTRILNKEKTRGYEFLIEFDVNKPSYGIYYGCRGLIFGKNQTQEILNFQKEWETILKPKVCEILNNTFQSNNFFERCLLTDNANNKTYWPFWIRLSEDEDIIEVAGLATRLIYNVYKLYLENPNSTELKIKPTYNIGKKDKTPIPSTHYTEQAFEDLFQGMKTTKKIINKILRKAENKGFIIKSKLYEKAWVYNEHKFPSDAEFALFLDLIYREFIENNNENEIGKAEIKLFIDPKTIIRKEKDQIKWALFTPYILANDGRQLLNLKKAYEKYKGGEKNKEGKVRYKVHDLNVMYDRIESYINSLK